MSGKLPGRIGRYQIQLELGEGAFGRVYRAYDPDVNRLVAIKVLLATDREVLTRFKNEATVAGNLRHKNIVTIYEFGEHEGQPYLAMEFLDGQNLQEISRSKKPLTILQKISIMTQVAEGLDCAHRSGVVHRDVKPANIMVLPDGNVKIMDFGIARLTSARDSTRLTQEGNMLGTLMYMAPEQFTPNAEVDALCDIFAYGELYYELLAGKHPFEAEEPRVLIYKLNCQDPVPISSLVPDCPEAMDQVISRLLARQRDLRYQSLRELLYDTQPILIDLQQERAATLAAEAMKLFQQQKLEEANRLMPEILDLDPANRTSHRLREAIQKELRDRIIGPKIEALLKTGREEMERRNFFEAIEAFESALRLDSSNREILGLLESARALLEKSKKAGLLVAEARRAFDQQNLAAAYRSASEALLHDPQNPAAVRLSQVIQAAIDQKRQQQQLQQALAKAENLLLIPEYDEALAALSGLDVHDPQVGSLIARIKTQKLEHERSVRLQAGMATGTELLRHRRLAEAVEHLTRLFAEFPETAELRHLLDYARNELMAEERAQAVLRIAAEAQSRADSLDFSGALDVLEKALREYDDSSLVRLLGKIMAAKAAWERQEALRTTKEQCDKLRGEGRLDEAIQRAESAIRSLSADPVLVGLLRDLERQRDEEKRRQEIHKALAQARKLTDAGEIEKAARFLADAALQFPESPDIQAALADAQEVLRAQEKARALEACARDVRYHVDAARYDSALQILDRTLETYPHDPGLVKLRESVVGKKTAWLRKQEIQRAVERAAGLARQLRFSEAADVLAEAQQKFEGEPALDSALQKLEKDRARHQRAQEVSQAAREARTLLEQDQPHAAVDFLVQACSRYPAEAELEKLLARAQREAAVEQLCRDVRALSAQREFARALQLIEQGLKNWPAELSLVSLKQEAAAGLAVLQREQAVRDALGQCKLLAGQERFTDALRLAETSLEKYPGESTLLAFRAEMQARLQEIERLRQRAADLDTLKRFDKEAQSIADVREIAALRDKIRAVAGRYPDDSEITAAVRSTFDQLSTMEQAGSMLARRDFAGVLGLTAPYLARIPEHKFFQRLRTEAERGERLARLAEIRQQLQAENNLERKAQLLDAATRTYPNEAWLKQEAQVVRGKLALVNSVVEKARIAEKSEHWDEALGQWNALREIYLDYPELDSQIARVTGLREQARAAAITRQIEQIQQHVQRGDYDLAGQLLQAGGRDLAADARIQPSRERIAQVQQTVREAKALAADQKFAEASKILETALARYHADVFLQQQLQDVQQQAERQAALREKAIAEAVRRCDLLAEQENFAEAQRLTETWLHDNPAHPALLAVQKRIQDKMVEAERLRQRNADLDALRRLDKEAQAIADPGQGTVLEQKIRALADQHVDDAEITAAAAKTLQLLSAVQGAGSSLAKQDLAAVLALCAKYPDHKYFQRLKAEANRLERLARLAEAERQVQQEPDLMRRAELLDRTTRLFPDSSWLRQESQVVQGKLGQIKTLVEKAGQAETADRWDEALEHWNAVREIYKDYPDLAKEMERITARKEQARIAARERLGEQIWQQVSAGDYESAGALLERAEKEFPGDAEFQFLRGQAASIRKSVREARPLADKGQFEQALKILQAALARYPGDACLRREQADVQNRVEQRKQAIAEAVQRCGLLAGQGNFAAALRLAESSLEQYPDHPELRAARERAQSGLAEAERLRRRNADLEALRRLDKDAQLISDSAQTRGLEEKVRALAGPYPDDSEITQAAQSTLQLLAAVEQAGSLLAERKFAAVLAACAPFLAKYPDHRLLRRVNAEAERGERQARLAEAERRVKEQPDLMLRAELLDQTIRLYPDSPWLRQESQIVQGKVALVNALVDKARQAEAADRWDDALKEWNAVREIYKDYPGLAKEMERVTARKEQARIAARERLGEEIWDRVNAGDYDGVGPLLERAGQEFPGDAEFQFLREQVAFIRQSVREARALAAAQNFEPACEILEKALARNAGDIHLKTELEAMQKQAERHSAWEAALASANSLLAGGRLDDALEALDQFTARYQSDPAIEQLRSAVERAREAARRKLAMQEALARCAALEKDNRLAEALAEIDRAIAEFGDDAAFQQSRRRVQAAIAEAERRRRRSADVDELHRLETAARQASAPARAIEILKQAGAIIARYKGDADMRAAAAAPTEQLEALQTAQRELSARHFESTLEICERLLQKYPGYVAFGEMKGEAERGQHLAFIKDLQKRISAEPNLEVHVRLLEDAQKRYPGEPWAGNELRAIEATLNQARSIAAQAEAHEQAGRWDEALAQWTNLRTVYKAYPDLEVRFKRAERKREEWRAAAIADWSAKVEAEIELGDLTKAGELLNRAGTEYPGTPVFGELSRRLDEMRQERARMQALLATAQQECERGRYQQGQAAFKEAWQSPQSDAATRKLVLDSLARYAQLAVQTDWRAAESLAREARGLDPKFEPPKGLQADIAARKKEEIVRGCLEQAEQLRQAGDAPGALVEVERGLLAYPQEQRLKRLREQLAVQVRDLQNAALGELDLMRRTAAAATDPAQLETLRERATALGAQYPGHAALQARSDETVRELTARIEEIRKLEREARAAALRKKVVVGAAAAVLLAGGFFGARSFLKSTELIPLEVSSSPEGAAIKAGTEVCGSPNCQLKLKPGTYSIEAHLDGYRPALQTVTVSAASHAPVKLVLEPLRPQIQVLSNFDAGTVLLDGRNAGELRNGQLTLENVAFGKHSIVVRSPDGQAKVAFKTAAGRLPVIEGKIESKDVDAVAVANLGRNARLECDCSGDQVTVDGKSAGRIADGGLDLHELGEGAKSVKLGERPLVVSVRPEPGLTLFVNSNRNIGTLVVETNVDNPTILINNRRYNGPVGPGLTRIPLDVAQYRVQLQKNGYKSVAAQTVQIEKGGTERLVFTLQPMNAVLSIQHAMPGTQVAVDGKSVGQVGADQRLSVDVGTGQHTIELSKQGYTPKRITRNFDPGQTVAVGNADALLSPDQNTIEETRRREEQAAWDAVNKNDRASLQQFIDSHASSRFVKDARAQIAQIDQAKTDQQRQEQLRRDEEQRKAALAAEQKAAQAEEQKKLARAEELKKAAEDEQQRKKLEASQALQRANAEKQAVLETLKRYSAAYDNRDADAVRAIYPSIDFKKIQSSFKIFREIRVTLSPEEPRISGENATVRAQRSILFTDERGKKLPQQDTITFVLRNTGNRWVIQSIQ